MNRKFLVALTIKKFDAFFYYLVMTASFHYLLNRVLNGHASLLGAISDAVPVLVFKESE